ncbi:glycosyltransferase family 2 protein [Actinomycetospora sp. CA-084318]|uniref:glycosyltransferase family 2 protein n=1 Tax=Actinomycetospora sp. CA-084318 TaxID=3239892 RepID=UPI003D997107
MRVAVVIASAGRPAVVTQCLQALARQTLVPISVVLSVPGLEDAPKDVAEDSPFRVVISPKGLTKQRNVGIDAVSQDHDLIAFFDDDFLPHETYLERSVQAFEDFESLIAADGVVLADGAAVGELSWAEAASVLESYADAGVRTPDLAWNHPDKLYGCNMVMRSSLLELEKFDEALPLYGWLEDRDISIRAGRHGNLARISGAVGVHRGVRGGRVNEARLGYSQIANPAHLLRVGVFSRRECIRSICMRVLGNLAGLVRDRPRRFDRVGRLKGNARALHDVLRGQDSPGRVTDPTFDGR